jgi:glycosyltransferase involved in cell wall biosynthesis
MTPSVLGSRTFWIDVEDFFLYFAASPRPSGIQRLVFETVSVMPARAKLLPDAPRIAFVRHSGNAALLREVPFEAVARLFDRSDSVDAAPEQDVAPRPIGTRQPLGRRLRLWMIGRIERLPPAVSHALLDAGVLQLNALRHARMLVAAVRRSETEAPAAAIPAPQPAADDFGGQPGDVFLVLGAPWMHRNYADLLRSLRVERGIDAAVLLYDLIPLRRPEWCARALVHEFTTWLAGTLPLYARLMAISNATARDVEAYAKEIGLWLRNPVRTVPIGTGFGVAVGQNAGEPPHVPGLPAPGSYVLFVSTLEARKNHALLFRVWRRLLAELPRAQVPTLVFAGRVGWLVADLLQQLENVDWLDGKVRLLRDPTDAELAALYDGCRFTLFPSLFEGWGLPVSESLALGRPCVASNCTSLPEAGGDLARYFDPENIEEAYQAIRAVIEDPAGLAAWRARVAGEFRPVSWDCTADAILAACAPARPMPGEDRR